MDVILEELRASRLAARRELELATLRSRPDAPIDLDPLRQRVRALTEELIRRYAGDLDLVDLLLGPEPPRAAASAAVNGRTAGGRR
ncbi:MAG: hypothetical protein Q7V58_08290 [Actinomycetota bacterium]|nr:hypothetical protein [Actinomycetota bacterium]